MISLFLALCLQSEAQGTVSVAGWCIETWIGEMSCVEQGTWESNDYEGSCIDQCCTAHDYCCATQKDATACSEMIANCAYTCSGPCADAIWMAMRQTDRFCCGGPCDQTRLDSLEKRFGERISSARKKTALEKMAGSPGVPPKRND